LCLPTVDLLWVRSTLNQHRTTSWLSRRERAWLPATAHTRPAAHHRSPATCGARDDAHSLPTRTRPTGPAVPSHSRGSARGPVARHDLPTTHRPIPSRHLRAPVAATATGSRHPPAHVATRHRGPGWVARPPALPRARSVTPSISPTSRGPADARGGRRSWSAGCPGAHAPLVPPGFFLIRRRRVCDASLIRYSILNNRPV